MCRRLVSNPFANSSLTTTDFDNAAGTLSSVRASLGAGMPSRPVLDSTGEHILIQTSDADIVRIKIDLKVQDYLKGWQEEIVGN
jgi:type IV pilus assembly protein PilY1